jgi:hypothetical protein
VSLFVLEESITMSPALVYPLVIPHDLPFAVASVTHLNLELPVPETPRLKLVPSNVNADPVAKALVLDAYTTPFAVNDVRLVPPLATGNVPVTPVVRGNPVQFVNVPDVGVPNTGVTKVGDVLSTTEPEPVDVVTPVPPLVTPSVPVTPVVSGKPVQLVSVPLAGVPSAGVVRVGDTSVNPDTDVVVVPRVRDVEPSVMAVAKLVSS